MRPVDHALILAFEVPNPIDYPDDLLALAEATGPLRYIRVEEALPLDELLRGLPGGDAALADFEAKGLPPWTRVSLRPVLGQHTEHGLYCPVNAPTLKKYQVQRRLVKLIKRGCRGLKRIQVVANEIQPGTKVFRFIATARASGVNDLAKCLESLSLGPDNGPIKRSRPPIEPPAPISAAATYGCKESCRQWPLDSPKHPDLDAGRAWAKAIWPLRSGVRVAVLDTEIDESGDLRLAAGGANRLSNYSGAPHVQAAAGGRDARSHGDRVAHIIGGKGVKHPYVGVAPGVEILSLPVLTGPNQQGDTGQLAAGIATAIAMKANVINLSLHLYTGRSRCIANMLERARDNDVVVVVAAGNDCVNTSRGTAYPASYLGESTQTGAPRFPNLLSVGATTKGGQYAPFTNHGRHVSLYAPAFKIPHFDGGRCDGTSFSAAYVSGAVALLRSTRPNLSASMVVRRILSNTGSSSLCPSIPLANAYESLTGGAATSQPSDCPCK